MNGDEQHKEEILERLKTVLESSGKSSRAFSKSIGLKPTSFHKVLTGTAGLTIPLANSIELNHGFRSEWLLSGNGKMKVNKHNQLSPLERCLLEVSLSSIQKWDLLEILIIEKINKRISDQFWGTFRDDSILQSNEDRRMTVDKNLEQITKVFRELREEGKNCLENQDMIGEKLFTQLSQALLLASFYGEEWDSIKNNCEEYHALEADGNLKNFEKLFDYINELLSEFKS